MKKVLHFITGLEKDGGAENMLLKALPHVKDTENRVCVAKGRGKIAKKLEEESIHVYYLDMKGFLDFGAIKRYRKIVNDFRPDVLVNYLIHADIFGRILGRKFGAKTIVSYIRSTYRKKKPLFAFFDRITLGKVDYLLTNSQANLEAYRQKYKFPKERSACIPNGVSINDSKDDFDKDKLRFDLGVSGNDFVITSVGRMIKHKGYPILFKAVRILKDMGIRNIRVLVCGQGEEKKNLILLRENLELEKEIKFLGVIDNVDEILNISDIFVSPSEREGMSNALLEAMNNGLACLVSNISANKELITNEENGLTFKMGDHEELARKIKILIDSRLLRKTLGEKARELIKGKYDVKKMINDLNLFLKEQAERRKKIIWITNSPNNIYFNLFHFLGERHKDLDLTIVLGIAGKREEQLENFKIRRFKRRNKIFLKIVFQHRFIIGLIKKKKVSVPNISFLKGLKKYLRKERPDLIMANMFFNPSSWQGFCQAKKMGRPFILITEKNKLAKTKADKILTKISFFLLCWIFSYAKFIFCWTLDGFNFAKKHFPIKDKEKIKLFPPGVNTEIFRKKFVERKDDRLKLLMVARFVPFKRHVDLFKAAKRLKEKDSLDFVLNLRGATARGDDPLERELKEKIKELNIEDRVNFVENYPYEKMSDLYCRNDIMILPSHNEPIGMVVPEAMASGLPAIVSDANGAKTFIKDGINGYIFRTFDHRDLAEKILLLADKKRREEFSQKAEEAIKEKFDSKFLADNFYNLIKNII